MARQDFIVIDAFNPANVDKTAPALDKIINQELNKEGISSSLEKTKEFILDYEKNFGLIFGATSLLKKNVESSIANIKDSESFVHHRPVLKELIKYSSKIGNQAARLDVMYKTLTNIVVNGEKKKEEIDYIKNQSKEKAREICSIFEDWARKIASERIEEKYLDSSINIPEINILLAQTKEEILTQGTAELFKTKLNKLYNQCLDRYIEKVQEKSPAVYNYMKKKEKLGELLTGKQVIDIDWTEKSYDEGSIQLDKYDSFVNPETICGGEVPEILLDARINLDTARLESVKFQIKQAKELYYKRLVERLEQEAGEIEKHKKETIALKDICREVSKYKELTGEFIKTQAKREELSANYINQIKKSVENFYSSIKQKKIFSEPNQQYGSWMATAKNLALLKFDNRKV